VRRRESASARGHEGAHLQVREGARVRGRAGAHVRGAMARARGSEGTRAHRRRRPAPGTWWGRKLPTAASASRPMNGNLVTDANHETFFFSVS